MHFCIRWIGTIESVPLGILGHSGFYWNLEVTICDLKLLVTGTVQTCLAPLLGRFIHKSVLAHVQAELCYQALEIIEMRTGRRMKIIFGQARSQLDDYAVFCDSFLLIDPAGQVA